MSLDDLPKQIEEEIMTKIQKKTKSWIVTGFYCIQHTAHLT